MKIDGAAFALTIIGIAFLDSRLLFYVKSEIACLFTLFIFYYNRLLILIFISLS